jgi:hypothetical protein
MGLWVLTGLRADDGDLVDWREMECFGDRPWLVCCPAVLVIWVRGLGWRLSDQGRGRGKKRGREKVKENY